MKFKVFATHEQFSDYVSNNGATDTIMAVIENGWICADLQTQCKSYKTAIKRFFSALNEHCTIFDGWEEQLIESCENGFFSDHCEGFFHYGIENIYAGLDNVTPLWYVYLNLKR